jgi:glucosamine--fructose-6-phosphate aminotransferase (isomerizing)
MTIMAQEIREIPKVVEDQLVLDPAALAAVVDAVRTAQPRWVSIVARGTSDHAAIYARYLIETQLGWPVSLASPSVTTIYGATTNWSDSLLLAFSQSGRSPDLVAVVEAARRGGALSVAITNTADSPLEAAAQLTVPCRAGPELAVAATKSYVAELAAVAGIVAALIPESALAENLPRVPEVLRQTLEATLTWRGGPGADLVGAIAGSGRALVISRGFNLATALETALKLKETGHVFAEGYSSADFEHGPIALAGSEIPALVFRPDGRMGAAIDPAIERARAAGAKPWIIGGPELGALNSGGSRTMLVLAALADLPECLTPLALVIPGQLLAEAVAVSLGLSPDRPVGLSKVTLTR